MAEPGKINHLGEEFVEANPSDYVHTEGFAQTPGPFIDTAPILEVVAAVVPDHEEWLETPNPVFHWRKPADLIREGNEGPVREILWSAVYVGVS